MLYIHMSSIMTKKLVALPLIVNFFSDASDDVYFDERKI